MEIFGKIVNEFQPFTIFIKSFLHLRCFNGFWILLWWLHHSPFLPKTFVPFSNISDLYLFLILPLSIFHWFSNKHGRKYMQMNATLQKCTYLHKMYLTTYLQYKTYFPLTKFTTVKEAKNKVYIFNWVFKLLEERFH